MFSLKYRNRLPGVIRDELDQLVTGLQQYLLKAHDQDGNDTGTSGANLTNLNATNLTLGTVPLARLTGLTNAQIGASAGISRSKLDFGSGLVDADIAAAAAIATSKIAFSAGGLTIGGALTATNTIQSSAANDLTVNANGANRDIILAVNGGEMARFVGNTNALNHGGDIVFTANTRTIRRNTSDGSDNGTVYIAGGGSADPARGAYTEYNGNESARPGYILNTIGNVTGAKFQVKQGDGTLVFEIDGNSGLMNLGLDTSSPYNQTTGAAANAFLSSDGSFARSTSSARYKANIRPMDDDEWHWLLRAKPITFAEKRSPEGRRFGGLLAEDVAAAAPIFAAFDREGRPDEVAYGHIVAPLICGFQNHESRLAALEMEWRSRLAQ